MFQTTNQYGILMEKTIYQLDFATIHSIGMVELCNKKWESVYNHHIPIVVSLYPIFNHY